MKRILLGDRREKLVATIEMILKHWGYRVMASCQPEPLSRFLAEVPPDLVILGSNLLTSKNAPFTAQVTDQVRERQLPLLVLTDDEERDDNLPPHETMTVPLDIFRLFTLIQDRLESTPRRNLRLKIQLPGMFYSGGAPVMAEVLSLSAYGLFIKTGCRVDNLEQLSVIFPLLGMQTEIEVAGRVLYRVKPGPENNYLQGVGIEFTDIAPETAQTIQDFIESRVLEELAESHEGPRHFDLAQLQVHSHRDLSLRGTPADRP
ncbi:hypothetical protein JCM30471_36140 [Desulfuromonas carbonis]|uniref:PilZ domain-containing protein n=1 Tax=Desulfuromonas sp. DDH964 TaxID=1823759 RepID=UPI00078C6408|nr:PilZ domain-containing protein [Desulfuromonas sp. DDH964]AMV72970.1 response regulator, PilZ domain-containing [Desulfuromonas sp. DDH964]